MLPLVNMKNLFIVVCCCTVITCAAQRQGSYNRFSKNFQLTARLNPIALFNPAEGSILAGIEKRVKRRVTVGGDVGYIFWSLNTTSFQGTNTIQGLILRPSIRYYTSDAIHFYVEAVFHYKMINNKQNDWVGMSCVNRVPTYFEFKQYNVRSNTAGMSANFGFCENIFKSKKLYIEFYGGIGVRYRNVRVADDPRACIHSSVNESPFDPLRTGTSILPFVPAGLRIGYVIK